MRVREAMTTDAGAMLALFDKLDRETDSMLFEPGERETTLEEQKNIIASFSASSHRAMYVAEQEEIVGFCVLAGNHLKRNAHVASLVVGVLRTCWGQGVGSALLKQTLSEANMAGIRRVELTVREDNAQAIGLYEKFGFVQEGIRTRSLLIDGNLVNEIYMARLFEPS